MMQAKYLRDVLKNTVIGYNVSRYGLLDPWSANNLPYASNGIRVFIDNQEITTAKYDNGLFLLGNINLSFVDHIEIYYLSPSYKISTEPAYVIVKLYSKTPERDEGKKIGLTYGSYGFNSQTFENADGKKNYFVHFSRSEVNHKDVRIDNTDISRDGKTYHFLWTFRNENTKYLLNSIYQNQEPFMGMSLDGKLQSGYEKYKEIQFGIEHKINELNLKYTLDYLRDKTFFYENSGLYFQKTSVYPYYLPVTEVRTSGYDVVNTLKLNNETQYKNHRLVYGISFRDKRMNYSEFSINGTDQNYNGIKIQHTSSVFLEDNIQIKDNFILTLGYEFSRYFNDVVDDYNLYQYKASGTYLLNKLNIMKLSFQHIEYSVPPYLYNTFYGNNVLKPQKSDVVIAKYKTYINEENDLEIMGFYGINKNYPLLQTDGTFKSGDQNIYVKMIDVKLHKNYYILNDLVIDCSYLKFQNTPLNRSYRVIVLNTHRYGKYDFFENAIYQNNEYKISGVKSEKKGFDLSLGVKYNYSPNLSFSLKGENLLNSSYETSFFRVVNFNPYSFQAEKVQIIDRKITAGMEYWF
ncbi:TonB-dependent receptor domain-containing protein [Nautilia sp.]